MGRVVLLPASHFDTFGDSNPRTWFYHATLTGPSDSRVYGIPADGVVHFRIGADAESPWQGRGPLARSRTTAALAAAVEASLTREARLPVGRIAPSGGHNPKEGGTNYGDDLVRGGLVVAGGAVVGPGPMASGEILSSRLKPASYGPEPHQVMEALRTDTGRDILSAFGVPAPLFSERSDGTGAAEAMRRFRRTTIMPLVRLIEAELQAKLEPAARVSLEALESVDDQEREARAVRARARAYKELTEAGIDKTEARRLAGLEG